MSNKSLERGMNPPMISENDIQFIISHRQPLSKKAQKLLDVLNSKNGKIKCTHTTFCKGLSLGGELDLLYIRLDECIEEDYVRIYESHSPGKENWYYTFEYFYFNVLPNLRNPEILKFHTQYIQQRRQEVQARITSR